MYRTVCCEFWTDPKVKSLSPSEKLLFLYLITNPHSHYSGIYYLPVVTMQHEVNIGRAFEGALKGVQTPFLVCYDAHTEQVWVKNMYEYQGRGKNMDKGVAAHLRTLHNSALIQEFVTYYPSVADYFDVTPFEPPSNPVPRSPSPVPVPDSDSSLSSLQSESEEGKECEKGEFEQFWQAYPRKVGGKKNALRAWEKAQDRPSIEAIVSVLDRAKQTEQWRKDGGQFIPYPATWLNRGMWADDLKPMESAFKRSMNSFLDRHKEDEV